MKFDLRHRTRFPVIFAVGCVVALLVFFVLPFLSFAERLTVSITVVTAFGGAMGFLYAEHTQETQLFRELFREFNARYDTLNNELIEIRNRPEGQALRDADYGVLCDYFNLCAEEHIYATAGCIDPRVWLAWQNGMRYFARDAEILELWKRELEQDSYYGFTLDFSRNA